MTAAPDLDERTLQVLEAAAPGVLGNPFVPFWPHPKQAAFLRAHTFARGDDVAEILFGGAAGPGKSTALLILAASFAFRFPHFRGLLLRRTYPELVKANGLLAKAWSWWLPQGVQWSGERKTFTFPNGATVEFGYHQHPTHSAKYQGGEWHFIGMDELTHWPDPTAYEELRSRLRRGIDDPIPLQMATTSNPGNVGHDWVKLRFMGGRDPITNAVVHPVGIYLPATMRDNPSLDVDAYMRSLSSMHPTRRAQLRDGDWSARDPGDYFRVEWFGPLLDPEQDQLPRGDFLDVRWWDLAASEGDHAARTAGVRMARLRSGVRVVTHAVAFRATPGKRDARIVQQAHADGRACVVGLEIEGGSGGIAQFETLAGQLRSAGFRVVGARPRAGGPDPTAREQALVAIQRASESAKAARADPVASCLERGYQRRGEGNETNAPWWGADVGKAWWAAGDGLRLYAGAWTQAYIDELEGFPGGALVDLVDATSGAWSWLEAHPLGASSPPAAAREPRPSVSAHDLPPEDRPERGDDRDRAGNWRP